MFLHSSGSNLSEASTQSGEGSCCWLNRDATPSKSQSRQSTPHVPYCEKEIRLDNHSFKCCKCKRRRKSVQSETADPLTACTCHKTYYHYTISGNYYTATPKRKAPFERNLSLDETPLSRRPNEFRTKPPVPHKKLKSERKWRGISR